MVLLPVDVSPPQPLQTAPATPAGETVSNGDELRTIALIPNLIIGYTSAKKL